MVDISRLPVMVELNHDGLGIPTSGSSARDQRGVADLLDIPNRLQQNLVDIGVEVTACDDTRLMTSTCDRTSNSSACPYWLIRRWRTSAHPDADRHQGLDSMLPWNISRNSTSNEHHHMGVVRPGRLMPR